MSSSATRSTIAGLVACVAAASGSLSVPGGASAFVQAPALHLDVTVGPNDGSGACPTETSISGPSGMSVTYCYRITNTGGEPLTTHELVDDQLGDIALPVGDSLDPIESGWDFFVLEGGIIHESTTTTATWTAEGEVTGLTAQDSASATVTVIPPEFSVANTVMVDTGDDGCGSDNELGVPAGTAVRYCYRLSNTGEWPLNFHDVVDDQLGQIAGPEFDAYVNPGESLCFTRTTTIVEDVTSVVTWTVMDVPSGEYVADTATATVTVHPGNPQGPPGDDVSTGGCESATPSLEPSWSVIAHGLADLDDGRHACTMTAIALAESGGTIRVDAPTFLYADGPVARYHLEHAWPSSPRVGLGAGDAVYTDHGSVGLFQQQVAGSAATDSTLYEIAISPADGSDDAAVAPGAGIHDIDLIRAILAPGASLTVPSSGVAACAFVPDGTVLDAQGQAIEAGTAAHLTGELVFTNPGGAPATVLVAVISPTLDVPGSGAAPTTSTTTVSPTSSPVTSPPTATPTNPPASTTIPATTASTTTTTTATTTTTTTSTTTTSLPPSFTTTTSTTSPVIVSPTTTTTIGGITYDGGEVIELTDPNNAGSHP